jgi:hypothetical protein
LWKSSLPKNQKFLVLNNRKGGNGNPQTDQKRLVVVIVEEEGEVPTSHKFCRGDFCREEEGGHVPAAIHSFICGEQREPGKQKTHKKTKHWNHHHHLHHLLLLLQAPEIKYNHHLLPSSSSSSRNQIQPPSSSSSSNSRNQIQPPSSSIFYLLLLLLQALFFPAPSGKLKIPQNTLQPIIIHHLSLQAHLIIFFFGNSKVCLHFFVFFKKSR